MVHVQFKIDNMNMKKYKLGDLLSEFHAGKAIQTENVKNKGAYPVYGGNGQRGYTDSYNQDGEYLIIGRQGAYCGNVRYNIGKAYLTEHAIVGQAKENHNPIYIALKLSLMKLSQLQGQSAQPGLSVNTLSCISMEMHPKEIQDKIADIMLKLDRKIELNKQINDNLEAMAKQLYNYWFVQFDFPNEEGKPYKSSGGAMVWNEKLKREIPEGWYAENICKIANILSGGTPSKAVDEYWNNGTIPFFGPTDCNGSVFQIKTADHITQKGLEHCASSLFEEGIVIITARGSIGKLVIVGTPMAMNQSCYALQSKEGEYEYLYFLTTQLIDCLKAKGSGSVFKSIIASDIEHSTLCIATENVVSDFCKKVKPLFEKLKANTIEIAELTKQRDELLPLLMNGQASVNYHLSDD